MIHPSKLLVALDMKPSKSLGQNFLSDGNIARKIVNSFVHGGDHLVEVGPGLGALTFLMEKRAASVIAVEVDGRLAEYLEREVQRESVRVIKKDFLEMEEQFFEKEMEEKGGPLTLFGNLPYSISGQIVMKIITLRKFFKGGYIMLQREVARRLTSSPGSKEYGALTVLLQGVSRVRLLFPVSKHSFYPVPEVDSSFLEIDFSHALGWTIDNFPLFRMVVNRIFQKRRKMIKNAIGSLSEELGMEQERFLETLEKEGISPYIRPENVSVERFVALAKAIGNDLPGERDKFE